MLEQEMANKNLILKVLVGSHLYGTSTPESDKDYIGIFVPTKDYVLGLKTCEQVELRTNPTSSGKRNTKEDVDTVLYSLPKFIKLAMGCNPNILEVLFVPKKNIVSITPEGQKLLDNFTLFVSKKVKHTFCGYAHAQKEKILTKKDRLDAIKHLLNDVKKFEDTPDKSLTGPVNLNGVHGTYKTYEKGTQYGFIISDLTKLLDEYGLRTKQIEEFGYDLKFASHLIRLLNEGIECLVEGKLNFPLSDRSYISDVKAGRYKIEEVLKKADEYESLLGQAYVNSKLPNSPDLDALNKFQITLLEDFWRNNE